jgi:NADPH:quinone reductase-like Zn-dependent oxidoreductase
MRGYVLNHYGDATAMTLRDVPAPAAEAGSVLIRVHAAGLNPIDYKIRQGKARLLYHLDLPLVAGSELAGVVAAMGPGGYPVRRREPGIRPGGQVPAGGLRGLRGGEREPGREDAGQAAFRAGRRPAAGRPDRASGPPR